MVSSDPEPDRLAAALAELEAVRRVPGWLPPPPDRSRPATTVRPRLPRRGRDRPDLPAADVWRRSAPLSSAPASAPVAADQDASPAGDDASWAAQIPATADGQTRSERRAAAGRARQPVLRTPAGLRGAVVAPHRWAVLGLAVAVLVAVALFATRALLARADSAPHPVATAVGGSGRTNPSGLSGSALSGSTGPGSIQSGAPRSPATAADRAAGAGGSGTAGAPADGSPAAAVEIHILGQVRRPGVVTVAAGARVLDVVEQAGGLLPSADLAQVNLARRVQDGEQIVVPRPGEHPATAPAPAATAAGASSAPAAPIDLNAADATALDALPGVGPVLAQRIVQYRTQNGPFRSVDQLDEVSGIGAKLLDQLRSLVRV